MENKIENIVALEYNGQPVLTTKQLTELFECGNTTIRSTFNYHSDTFIEGVDYFYLTSEQIRDFLKEYTTKTSNTRGVKNFHTPVSKLARFLYLWTKNGTLKLSRFIGTDKAKAIYVNLALGYFKAPAEPTTSLFAPKQPALFDEPQVQSPPSDFDQLEKLLNIIDKCSIIKDENLRDKLIRQAATLLFNKDF